MNTYQVSKWAFPILALAQAACATTARQNANPRAASAVGSAAPVCRVVGAPFALARGSDAKPYLPDGLVAVAEENRLEAVFTSRSARGRQCVAVDLETRGPRAPRSAAEREACGGLGKVESPAAATSDAETMLAWDTTRDDRSDLFVGVVMYDIPAPWPGAGRPHASVAAHAVAMPPGGLDGPASHPSLADIGHERFLLAWTQGTAESSQLRAQPVAGWGDAIGPAFDVSPADASVIGTSSAAFKADGEGFVTYFASNGEHIDVMTTRVACSEGASTTAATRENAGPHEPPGRS
jgi:hypothetical protein